MRRTARFSFLLPSKFNDLTEVPSELFLEVQKTLVEEFGGVTFQPQPALRGLWMSPTQKAVVPDDLVLYQVWTEDCNRGRKYFQKYKKVLLEKFKQEEIAIVEDTIEVI